VILSREALEREGDGLAERAYIELIPTPKAKPRPEKYETSGMCLMAAVPIRSDGNVTGAIYGGVLLNRNFDLVDEIRDIIFKERWYRGKEFGTVTIFQWDVRIATNVLKESGERAIGTRVSEEVYDTVLLKRKPWFERAFVVHDWYISAYEPIFNPKGKVIGILYVGVLEKKYNDIRNRALLTFFPPLAAGVLIVLIFSFMLSHDLSLPMRKLVEGAERIASGDLDYRIEGKARFVEMKQLMDHFNRMAQALKEREGQLERANEELRNLNRNYMEMLGFVSHEIKNALGNMLMSAYNLKEGYAGQLNEVQSRMVGIILRNSERLKDMIKNYLDLSRIEKGELEAHKRKVEFNEEILSPVIEELKGQMESKEMRLTVQTPDPFELVADPDMLRTIVDNLLSNAIKYGKEGGEIRVIGAEENGHWKISLWNEGEGIPPDQLPLLFTKFTRLDTGGSRRKSGSGLGLFITKEMVERQGGRIWAESEYGKWAMFTFTLPKEGE
ncbi:TPA: HAMP domain-containing protein, partial [Candidatus Poribacteria bacterium]|nr:HAMP domain-containing protein [Candidatus Poribacteria bacterium]